MNKFRRNSEVQNLIIIGAILLVIFAVLGVTKFADYKFCEKRFQNEVFTCFFSSKYRAVSE